MSSLLSLSGGWKLSLVSKQKALHMMNPSMLDGNYVTESISNNSIAVDIYRTVKRYMQKSFNFSSFEDYFHYE